MSTDRIAVLEALLTEAEAAHGVYETTTLNGVYDEAWPRWYAEYAVNHGVGELLAREVTADEVAGLLESAWDGYRRADPKPAEAWPRYTARMIAARL